VRELDEVLGLTEMAGVMLQDGRMGRNIRHRMTGLLRQSVYVRLAGYEDVNDQEALARDPAMRAVVGKKVLERGAVSSQTVSRFETQTLTSNENVLALVAINHAWVARAMPARKSSRTRTRPSLRCTESRRARPTTGTSTVPATIPCSSSAARRL